MKKRKILVRPLFTEKIARMGDEQNKYAFEVDNNANKIEIKAEIEKRFDVNVLTINTMNVRGKVRQQMTRAGRFSGTA